MIDRQGYALVADFPQERDRLQWIVMGEAVSVVTEEH